MPAKRGGVEAALSVHTERANWLCVMELKKSGWILWRQSNKKWHRASWWLSWQSVTLDVLQVFFWLSCHMPPPSLSHRCCHSPLSPNKHMQNAQQTYRDALKTGTTFFGTRLALGVCINTLPKRWGIVFTFLETLYCRGGKKKKINTSSWEKPIKGRVVYDTLWLLSMEQFYMFELQLEGLGLSVTQVLQTVENRWPWSFFSDSALNFSFF